MEIDYDLFFATVGINNKTGKFVIVTIQDHKWVDDEKVPCYYDRGISKDFDTIIEAVEHMNAHVDSRIRKCVPDNLERYKITAKVKPGMYISHYRHKDKRYCGVEVRAKNDYRLNPLFTITEDELQLLIYTKRAVLDCTGYDENEARYHYYVE